MAIDLRMEIVPCVIFFKDSTVEERE
jgi:hypothetical protein